MHSNAKTDLIVAIFAIMWRCHRRLLLWQGTLCQRADNTEYHCKYRRNFWFEPQCIQVIRIWWLQTACPTGFDGRRDGFRDMQGRFLRSCFLRFSGMLALMVDESEGAQIWFQRGLPIVVWMHSMGFGPAEQNGRSTYVERYNFVNHDNSSTLGANSPFTRLDGIWASQAAFLTVMLT